MNTHYPFKYDTAKTYMWAAEQKGLGRPFSSLMDLKRQRHLSIDERGAQKRMRIGWLPHLPKTGISSGFGINELAVIGSIWEKAATPSSQIGGFPPIYSRVLGGSGDDLEEGGSPLDR
jgi:hypothetical protein